MMRRKKQNKDGGVVRRWTSGDTLYSLPSFVLNKRECGCSTQLIRRRQVVKNPFVTLEQVQEIAKRYPTPFYLYDEKGIRENAKKVQRAFAWNPGFKEYFAVKATPNPFLMKILHEYGCGSDCSSPAELMLAEAAGITGQEIMYSSNDTEPEEFRYANELGRLPETMSCRFNPGGVYRLSNGIMDNPGDSKYGMTEEQIFEAYRILKQKGVKHFGLHAFLVSNTVTNDYYPARSRMTS